MIYYSGFKINRTISANDTVNVCEEIVSEFVAHQRLARLEDVVECWKLISTHFEKERAGVGLHGLYTKYKDYAEPLAKLFFILGRLIIILHLKEDKGTHADICKLNWVTFYVMTV